MTAAERIKSRTQLVDDCWMWTGKPHRSGYGRVVVDGQVVYAHRAAYETFVGPIPDGMEIDHLCHDPLTCVGGGSCPHRMCVNPAHLEAVKHVVNVYRGKTGLIAARTHCDKGHEFTGWNLRVINGKRRCRECDNEAMRRYRARKKAAA